MSFTKKTAETTPEDLEKREILHVFDVYYPKRGILTSYLTFVIYGIQKIKQSNALWC